MARAAPAAVRPIRDQSCRIIAIPIWTSATIRMIGAVTAIQNRNCEWAMFQLPWSMFVLNAPAIMVAMKSPRLRMVEPMNWATVCEAWQPKSATKQP